MTLLYEKTFENQRGKKFCIRNDDPIFKKFVIYSRGILADNPNPKHGIKERRNLTLQWNTDYAE